MTDILMPKATAVWLVDNTSLTFEQIADFCGLHPLEVRGIADGEVARDIRGADPIANGQLSREELDAAQKNAAYRMKAQKSRHAELLKPTKKAPCRACGGTGDRSFATETVPCDACGGKGSVDVVSEQNPTDRR